MSTAAAATAHSSTVTPTPTSTAAPAVPLERTLARLAVVAGLCALAMLGIALATGVSQEPLQVVQSPEHYAALLLARPLILRLIFAIDGMFLIVYGTYFALQAGWLVRERPARRAGVYLATGLLLVTAILDAIENLHIVTMLTALQHGTAPAMGEIAFQNVLSAMKFTSSYAGLFGLAFVLPRRTWLERALATSMFVYAPIGVLAHVAPHEWVKPLVLARLVFFVGGLFGYAKVFADRAAAARPAE